MNQGQRARSGRRHLRRAAVRGVGLLGALALSAGALVPASASPASAAGPWFSLHQGVPVLPAGASVLGAASSGQVLHLDAVLAGADPVGLAQTVAAISTPGSPEYRHYLTPAQFASRFGPTTAEVAQATGALRREGLTVGSPQPGSALVPVSGTVAQVSAAFGTSLASVQAPDAAHTVVNTTSLEVPAALAGVVTGVVGLDGLFEEHAMLRPHAVDGATAGAAPTVASGARPDALVAHASVPQACPAAQSNATGGSYTSTQLASLFGLDQLWAAGRTGVGQAIAVVEFEQYLPSDVATFQSCYGLSNTVRNEVVDGPVGGPPQGSGEAALDTELALVNAPSASVVVYQAPNQGDTAAIDLFNRIATDDSAQIVSTSWGQCEAVIPAADRQAENAIFQRMAAQGQTVVAAAGDAGSSDCYADSSAPPAAQSSLGVDDPASQPDVVGVGGTTLQNYSVSSQVVWNDCDPQSTGCAALSFTGSGGGGYSLQWPAVPGQPPVPANPQTTPCGQPTCRAVPDISYPANPSRGGVVAYFAAAGGWSRFGGTSVAAPVNAALFADVNQGCASVLGRVGPTLYADASSNTFSDIASGNNDFTGTHSGLFTAVSGTGVSGYDPASGLGTPRDQNLAATLQGAGGCPAVSTVTPNTGPLSGGGVVTVEGGGLASATSVSFGAAGAGQILQRSDGSLTVLAPAAAHAMCVDVTVTNPLGTSATSPADHYAYGGDFDCGDGYRFAASDGGVFSYGSAGFYGSMGGRPLVAPVVGMASTLSTRGYWEVATDGGLFSFGDAQFYGSMGAKPLNKPIVGMAATPDGAGYWEVASDGGIFSFGDAQFFGSTGAIRLNQPVVGMAPAPDGGGYWLVASDGGIFDYGSAGFYGSAGSLRLNKPVVGMAATPDGHGYWLVASDGGIFTYGDAPFYGSTGGITLNRPIVGMSSA